MSIGGLKPVKNGDGSTSYYSKIVNSENEAEALITEYADYKLKDLEVIYEYNGNFYNKAEFLKLSE
jgi:hypothetical protein